MSESQTPPPLAGGGWGERATPTRLVDKARALRRDATPAEKLPWQRLRNHAINGLKFRRQVPLRRYIADFYCPTARLVIELDRVLHTDAPRDAWMARQGIRVVCVANRDVLGRLENVVAVIAVIAAEPPPPNPLPQGEGEAGFTVPIHLHV